VTARRGASHTELEADDETLRSFVAAELGALRLEPSFDSAAQSATVGYGPVAAERADNLLAA
jgi:hypothetical protein